MNITLDEVPILYMTALCAWREARGESDEAIRGVLHVIRNRALQPAWWGKGYIGVILKPMQFSSFNADDPNALKFPMTDDARFPRILELAAAVISGEDEDPTHGASHYHATSIAPPKWAATLRPTVTLGHHAFYSS